MFALYLLVLFQFLENILTGSSMRVKPFSPMNMQQTKTSKFINFIIKICLIPVSTDGEKIKMRLFSLRSVLHFIVFNGTVGFCSYVAMLEFSFKDVFYMITFVLTNFSSLGYVNLSLIMSYGLNNLDKEILLNPCHKWPKQGTKSVLSFLLFTLGVTLAIINKHRHFNILTALYLIFFTTFFSQSLMISPLVAEIVLGTFCCDCNNTTREFGDSFIRNVKLCFQKYYTISNALKYFCFCFYILNQLMNIFFIFFLLSFFNVKTYSVALIMIISGYILNICCVTTILISMTEAFDDAFQAIQDMRGDIIERLLETSTEQETKQLEYLKNKSELIKPMNAAGYFCIEKSTLTSMLSVR